MTGAARMIQSATAMMVPAYTTPEVILENEAPDEAESAISVENAVATVIVSRMTTAVIDRTSPMIPITKATIMTFLLVMNPRFVSW